MDSHPPQPSKQQLPTEPNSVDNNPTALQPQLQPSQLSCQCPQIASTILETAATASATSATGSCPNVVTIPVPIVQNEDYYVYVAVKGSLHDSNCFVFGLNPVETAALRKRYTNSMKKVNSGFMISETPVEMLNTLAQLGYKVICACGEAEICWTMQREI